MPSALMAVRKPFFTMQASLCKIFGAGLILFLALLVSCAPKHQTLEPQGLGEKLEVLPCADTLSTQALLREIRRNLEAYYRLAPEELTRRTGEIKSLSTQLDSLRDAPICDSVTLLQLEQTQKLYNRVTVSIDY